MCLARSGMKKKERESGLGFVQKEKNGEESKKEREEEGEEWVKYLASNFTKMPPII